MLDLLKGMRVISFNHFLMGPMGLQVLGDLGADVIAIEPTEGAWQRHWFPGNKNTEAMSTLFLCANRNKRSVALNLKSSKAKDIAMRLCQSADVVTENFRPGVMDRLGFGYEALKAMKSDLIFASASGFGSDGPYVDRPGQDLMIQAMFGLAKITGRRDTGPATVGVSVADHHGATVLAMSILAALVRRQRTGQGCRVDVNLMQASMDLQGESMTTFFNGAKTESEVPPRYSGGWYFPAPYGIYPTKDGYLAISLGEHAVLAKALDEPRISEISKPAAFGEAREALAAMVAARMITKSNGEWISVMTRLKIWHAPVRGYDEVLTDPQVIHNKAILTTKGVDGEDLTFVNHPAQYDGQAAEVNLPPQRLGAQTAEVLTELGISETEQVTLELDGVIRRI